MSYPYLVNGARFLQVLPSFHQLAGFYHSFRISRFIDEGKYAPFLSWFEYQAKQLFGPYIDAASYALLERLLDIFGVPADLALWYNSISSKHLSHLEAFSSISLLFLPFLQP